MDSWESNYFRRIMYNARARDTRLNQCVAWFILLSIVGRGRNQRAWNQCRSLRNRASCRLHESGRFRDKLRRHDFAGSITLFSSRCIKGTRKGKGRLEKWSAQSRGDYTDGYEGMIEHGHGIVLFRIGSMENSKFNGAKRFVKTTGQSISIVERYLLQK